MTSTSRKLSEDEDDLSLGLGIWFVSCCLIGVFALVTLTDFLGYADPSHPPPTLTALKQGLVIWWEASPAWLCVPLLIAAPLGWLRLNYLLVTRKPPRSGDWPDPIFGSGSPFCGPLSICDLGVLGVPTGLLVATCLRAFGLHSLLHGLVHGLSVAGRALFSLAFYGLLPPALGFVGVLLTWYCRSRRNA